MPIRITGMNSGLDTEAIITQLASARSVKVNSLKKAQIKQQWTQDAWKDLNKKIYSFYTDTLSDMQYVGNYSKKNTKISDTSKVSVTTTGNAVNGTQFMSVQSLAKSAYLTGGEISADSGSVKMSDLGFKGQDAQIDLGNDKHINVSESDTIDQVMDKLKGVGLNASYDKNQKRVYISSKSTGSAGDFNLSAGNAGGLEVLSRLGLNVAGDSEISALNSMAATFMSKEASVVSTYKAKHSEAELKEKLGEKYTDAAIYGLAKTEAKIDAYEKAKTEWETKNQDYLKWEENNEAYKRWTAWQEAGDDTDKQAELRKSWGEDDTYTPTQAEDPGEAPKMDGERPVNTLATENQQKAYAAAMEQEYTRMNNINTYATTGSVPEMTKEAIYGLSNGKKVDGSDAEITLNGVKYTNKTNNFEINGLSITALEESEKNADGTYKTVTLTTSNDTSGIKDMIKNFFTKYNELINEMGKLYNADANKDYQPLLSEEKAELSDHEIEEWENKVKESLLRKDNTLSNVMSSMVEAMNKGFEVTRTTSSGTKTQTMYLQDFGIDTLGYFKAAENERNAYHIDGDEDDEVTSNNSDTLGYLISTDPDAVSSFFSQLTKGVYSQLSDLMKSTNYSSAYTVYEDKAMRSEYSDYNDRIKSAEDKLNAYLDNWYARFSKMETAMANLNSKQSSLSGLFG